MDFLGLDDWKTKAQTGAAPAGAAIRKAMAAGCRALGGEESTPRTLAFTISTGSVDRERDTLDAAGWQLDAYRRSPVVLWAHDYSALPVARALEISTTPDALIAHAEFVSRDVYPFADIVYQMLKGGFLSATSVGFRPLTYVWNEERRGMDFATQELLEFSIVPVPANPEALIQARGAGMDTAPLRAWAEQWLATSEGPGFWASKSVLEAMAKGTTVYSLPSITAMTTTTNRVGELEFSATVATSEPKAAEPTCPDADCPMDHPDKEDCPEGADCGMAKGRPRQRPRQVEAADPFAETAAWLAAVEPDDAIAVLALEPDPDPWADPRTLVTALREAQAATLATLIDAEVRRQVCRLTGRVD